jgi:hypothetical protein
MYTVDAVESIARTGRFAAPVNDPINVLFDRLIAAILLCDTPFTVENAPPTYNVFRSGDRSNAYTRPFNVKLNDEINAPVDALNAAKYVRDVCDPDIPAPGRTDVKFPPA